jgi:hypothetical protein
MQHFLYYMLLVELTRRGKAIKLLADCLNLPFMWWAALSLLWPWIPAWTAKVSHLDVVQLLQTGKDQRDQGLQIGTGLETTWDTGQRNCISNLNTCQYHWFSTKNIGFLVRFFVLESMPWASPRCTHLPESTLSGLLFSVKSQWTTKENIGGSIG